MQRRPLVILAGFGVVAALVACTLNPQPLPPRDSEATYGDASATADGGFNSTPSPADAAPGSANSEGGAPMSNDGGDGGEGGLDGSSDAADADAG